MELKDAYSVKAGVGGEANPLHGVERNALDGLAPSTQYVQESITWSWKKVALDVVRHYAPRESITWSWKALAIFKSLQIM